MEFSGQYLTYTEYQSLGGSLAEAPFNILEYEARKLIDKYTFGRLKDLDSQVQEVKMCEYKLINTFETYSNFESRYKGVKSENIDGYAITFNDMTKDAISAKNSELQDIISTYLSQCYIDDKIPYLYRGIDDN